MAARGGARGRIALCRERIDNLNGPLVRHARQSNVWRNLTDEVRYLQANESLWAEIATHPSGDYADLLTLLPINPGEP